MSKSIRLIFELAVCLTTTYAFYKKGESMLTEPQKDLDKIRMLLGKVTDVEELSPEEEKEIRKLISAKDFENLGKMMLDEKSSIVLNIISVSYSFYMLLASYKLSKILEKFENEMDEDLKKDFRTLKAMIENTINRLLDGKIQREEFIQIEERINKRLNFFNYELQSRIEKAKVYQQQANSTKYKCIAGGVTFLLLGEFWTNTLKYIMYGSSALCIGLSLYNVYLSEKWNQIIIDLQTLLEESKRLRERLSNAKKV